MATSTKTEDLDTLIRQVVREELLSLLRSPETILAAWEREEHDEVHHDAILLREATEILKADGARSEAWMSWDEVEAELDRAEAAGELPD